MKKLLAESKAAGAVEDSVVALIRGIADQLNAAISTNRLERFRRSLSPIRRTGRKSAGKAAKYRAAYKKLKSYAKVAKKYGVNVGTVWRAVNRGK
jgi:DNA invertase Pin-like site-specific DNA recombinase